MVITLEAAEKRYGAVAAVRRVSLEVAEGELVLISGRSGAGKTTLLSLAGGLVRPTAGRVLWQGVDPWRLPDRQRSLLRNRKIGFVFQFPSLLPWLTLLENVALPAGYGGQEPWPAACARAAELLAVVGLAEHARACPRQLSAGQQQRAVVARSLVNRPAVLLADEPTSNLDERTAQEIVDLLERVHAASGLTIVMVSHATGLAARATRVLEMAEGQLAAWPAPVR